MIKRKRKNGGFNMNQSKSYQMCYSSIPNSLVEAYIYWALTESKIVGFDQDIKYIKTNLMNTDDAYTLALVAISLNNLDENISMNEILEKLSKLQTKDGNMKGNTTITGSGGNNLLMETTSITVLAWMRNETKYKSNIFHAMKWIFKNCKNGSFGSTQATALALKAICQYNNTQINSTQKIQIEVPGFMKQEFSISAVDSESITIPIQLKSGLHDLFIHSSCDIPYSLTTEYLTSVPNSSDECVMDISTKLSEEIIKEGSSTEIQVEIQNQSNKSQTMTTGKKNL